MKLEPVSQRMGYWIDLEFLERAGSISRKTMSEWLNVTPERIGQIMKQGWIDQEKGEILDGKLRDVEVYVYGTNERLTADKLNELGILKKGEI